MSGQDCQKASAAALHAQNTAHELFQIAALLLGDGERAVALVEGALAVVDADPCADAGALEQVRPRLMRDALRLMAAEDRAEFSPPPEGDGGSGCIDSDDLDAAGLRDVDLNALLDLRSEAPERPKLREWLEALPGASRAIFVMRAIAGLDGAAAAAGLRQCEAPDADAWNEARVRVVYRGALCLLASSLAALKRPSLV